MTGKSTSTLATVVSNSTHAVTLDDGRVLAPGDQVIKVDLSTAYNRDLYFDGHIAIVDGFTPRTRIVEDIAVPDTSDEGDNS